mmetsp:Transcript_13460/g.28904  ORF Transcript_13460/g.28904 Transcript_13460/m.28904 type:complete len:122 (+) Transcript_13460:136-501(+)
MHRQALPKNQKDVQRSFDGPIYFPHRTTRHLQATVSQRSKFIYSKNSLLYQGWNLSTLSSTSLRLPTERVMTAHTPTHSSHLSPPIHHHQHFSAFPPQKITQSVFIVYTTHTGNSDEATEI